MKIKEEFHHLIDSIEDEETLKAYYQLVQNLNDNQNGELWNKLTDEQKQDLLLSYEESFDPANMVSHEQVKESHKKWLEK
jgi:hypothetical protein